jgi:peptidoglycan/xylan/chitin deacetylase (PgdA/CDA1 family)
MNVPVFLYHHTQPLDMARLLGHPQLTVDSNIFDEQMRYLAENGYNVISAEDLIIALNNEQRLPAKTVVVTIDDGYDDNYTYAFSTAKKYHIVINFMIPTGLIGNVGYMTWDHLKEMKNNPYARVYSHTWSHYALGGAGSTKVELEVMNANKQFEEYLGIRPVVFTYPYGSYDELTIDFLRDHGFTGAYSTIEGSLQCKSQIMTLQRMHIGNAPMSFYGF